MSQPKDPPPLEVPAGSDGSVTEVQERPASRSVFIRYLIGFLVLGFLWIGGLMIVNAVVLPQRLKELGVEKPASVVAGFSAFGAVTALVSNLVWGSLSDRTRSRFGRRTPWMLAGALLAGFFLWATSVAGHSTLLIVVWCCFQTTLNMLLAPTVAVMSDRVPRNQLATVSAFYGVGVSAGIQVGIIIGSRFIENTAPGFVLGAAMVAVSAIFAIAVWPKEPSTKDMPASTGGLKDVLLSMRPPGKAPDFWWMFGARFSILVAYAMIQSFQLFILQDYVGLAQDEVKSTLALGATITLVVSLVGGFIGGPISDLIKRLKLPVVVSTFLFAIGIAMPWIWPSTTGYYLWALIAGFGYGVYNSIDQAILVSVLPNKENAGKDLGVLNASTTAGQAAGPLITGGIVGATASYSFAFPVAVGFAMLAAFMVTRIKNVR